MENNEMNSFEYNDVHVKDKVTGKVVEVKRILFLLIYINLLKVQCI